MSKVEESVTTIPNRIALIGLGLLGGAIAERLLKGAWIVSGFDIDADALQRHRERGGKAVARLEELQDYSSVLLCLPNSDIVAEVAETLFDICASGSVIIDTTTGDPRRAQSIATRAAERGLGWVEANVLGSSTQMRSGEAVLLVGGEQRWIDACQPILRAISDKRFHCGASGAGQWMKLAANLVLGLNRAALAEGLYFAEAAGLDLHQVLEVLSSGAAYSRAMDSKGVKMIQGEYAPQARLSQHLKDVRLILETAAERGASLPLSTEHSRILDAARMNQLGDLDNSAIFEALRRGLHEAGE